MKIHFDFAISPDITEKRLLKLGLKKTELFGWKNQPGEHVFVVGRTQSDTGEFYDTITFDPRTMIMTAEYGAQFPDTHTRKVRSMRDVKQFLKEFPHDDNEAAFNIAYGKKTDTVQVVLRHFGPHKVAVIMEVKDILNVSVQEAKKVVDSWPVVLRRCKTLKEAQCIQARLVEKEAIVGLCNTDLYD